MFGALLTSMRPHQWVKNLFCVAPLAFSMGVALNALEFLVAGLQAYVFAILTCVYLNDAMHPSH